MNIDDIKLKIHIAFANKGIFVDDDDIPLEELIIDSIVFVTLVIELESVLDIEFPDELLTVNSLGSINTLSETLLEFIGNDQS
jgi:acyl carrier protein